MRRWLPVCLVVALLTGASVDARQDLTTLLSSFLTNLYAGKVVIPPAGTVTLTGTSAPAIDAAQTWNNAATTFVGLRLVVTDTASGASSLPLQILCGAAGATNCFQVGNAGAVVASGQISTTGGGVGSAAGSALFWSSRAGMRSPADGQISISNAAVTIGSTFKVDALPTVASGFGTSPAVTAGSTPLAGSVNIGTGGVATSGVINFNGTAFPAAPFCLAGDTTSNIAVRATTSTTQLTLTVTVAWTASDVVSWLCFSPRA